MANGLGAFEKKLSGNAVDAAVNISTRSTIDQPVKGRNDDAAIANYVSPTERNGSCSASVPLLDCDKAEDSVNCTSQNEAAYVTNDREEMAKVIDQQCDTGGRCESMKRAEEEKKLSKQSRRKWFLCCSALLILAGLLLVVIIIVLVYKWKINNLSASLTSPLSNKGAAADRVELCLTPICMQTAWQIMSAMNSTADPCQDFYEFACGDWVKNNPLTEDEQAVNLFQRRYDEVDANLRRALSAKPLPTELPIIMHTKRFYRSCLNETVIESREMSPFDEPLRQFGWWNAVDALLRNRNATFTGAKEREFALEDLLAMMRVYGVRTVFDVWVAPDDKNSTIYSIYFDQGDLSLNSRDYYLLPSHAALLDEYESMIAETIMAIGASSSYSFNSDVSNSDAKVKISIEQARIVARTILNTERKLASFCTTPEERRQSPRQYNNITIASLMQLYPRFNWHRYVSEIFKAASVNITLTDSVVLTGASFVEVLMKSLDSFSYHELTAYSIWRYIYQRLPYLGKKQRILANGVNRLLRGTVVEKERWQTCLVHTNQMLSNVVARIFLEESNFDQAQRAEATRMISDVKEAFIEALSETEWMEERTRQSAILKARAMEDQIGYPDYLMNDTYLNEHFGAISMSEDRFFENYNQLERFKTVVMMKNWKTFVDKSIWTSSAASINAYHSSNRNQIALPAGILHPPFFHIDFPKAVNYGTIGVVIGHEITHGFDDKGRQYDSQGNLRSWWSDRDARRFKEKAQCVIDQYSSYFLPEANMSIRGAATQGENIADNGGIKYSYKAYKKWVGTNGEEKRLPNMTLTNDQVFFVTYAQIWCENRRKESTVSRLISTKHSPSRFRVIGSISNQPEFAEAFGCAAGTPMNPTKKCNVW